MNEIESIRAHAATTASIIYEAGYDAAAEPAYTAGHVDGYNKGAREALNAVRDFPNEVFDVDGEGDFDFSPDALDAFKTDEAPGAYKDLDEVLQAVFSDAGMLNPEDRTDFLLAQLERWAPDIDDALDRVEASFVQVEASFVQVANTFEAVFALSSRVADRLTEHADQLRENNEVAEADALYVENLAEQVEALTARTEALEKVLCLTQARRLPPS